MINRASRPRQRVSCPCPAPRLGDAGAVLSSQTLQAPLPSLQPGADEGRERRPMAPIWSASRGDGRSEFGAARRCRGFPAACDVSPDAWDQPMAHALRVRSVARQLAPEEPLLAPEPDHHEDDRDHRAQCRGV
jgi:hypothetical protein